MGLIVVSRKGDEPMRLANELGAQATLGVGDPCTEVLEAGNAIPAVAHVAEAAKAMRVDQQGPRVFHHRDARLRGLIALLANDPRVQGFVENELSSVLSYDAAHDTDLLDLLRTCVQTGGNKTQLAERQHLSRPTLYKRLAHLERVLGADLSDPGTLLSLGVAVLAYDQRR